MAAERKSIRAAIKSAKGAGDFITPESNTLLAHYSLVADTSSRNAEHFDHENYAFDDFVTRGYKGGELFKQNHPNFQEYKWVRRNVTLVRNYVMAEVFKNLDKNDPAQVDKANQMLAQMGTVIGKAMLHDSLIFGYMDSLKVSDVSDPGLGAVEIYKKLLEKQEGNPIMNGIRRLFFRQKYADWKLPPLEESPFSDANVAEFEQYMQYGEAALNNPASSVDSSQMAAAQQATLDMQQSSFAQNIAASAGKLAALATAITGTALSLARVEALPKPVKKEAVDIARDILRNLRLNAGDVPMDQWRMRPADQAVAEGDALVQASKVYGDLLHQGLHLYEQAGQDPLLLQADPILSQANDAVGKLTAMMQMQSLEAMQASGADPAQIAVLQAEIEKMPPSWLQTEGVTIGQLAAQIEAGIDRNVQIVTVMQQRAAQVPTTPEGRAALSPEVLKGLAGASAADPDKLAKLTKEGAMKRLQELQSQPVQQQKRTPVSTMAAVPAERKPILPAKNHQEQAENVLEAARRR